MALEGTFNAVGAPAEGVIVLPVVSLPVDTLDPPDGAALARWRVGSGIGSADRASRAGARWVRCGAAVRRRFLPGHDAKLKSRLLRARAEDLAAPQQPRELDWLDDDAP